MKDNRPVEIWNDGWMTAYVKGHIDHAEFMQMIEDEDFEWYEPDKATAIYDYARIIPGEWEGEKCMLTWFNCRPGRGAFKVTRLDYM